jgi:hypothetical protein
VFDRYAGRSGVQMIHKWHIAIIVCLLIAPRIICAQSSLPLLGVGNSGQGSTISMISHSPCNLTSQASPGTCSVTGVTTGNTLFFWLITTGASTSVSACSDANNTYTRGISRNFASGAAGSEMWYKINATGGSLTISCSWTGGTLSGVEFFPVELVNITGFDTSAAGATCTSGCGTTVTTNSLSTNYSNEYVTAGMSPAVAGTITANSPFTLINYNSSSPASAAAYEIVSSKGSYQASFGISSGANWEAQIGGFHQ